jgi:hypothetical protein
VQNLSFSSSILLTCKSFWQIPFSECTFFNYFHGFVIRVKFCVFRILISKKRIKIFWGHYVQIWVLFGNNIMQIHKKWLIQFKNFFNKPLKEYYLASFHWWIPSSCENHCNLMYTPDERADTFSLSRLFPSLLSGADNTSRKQMKSSKGRASIFLHNKAESCSQCCGSASLSCGSGC